jgi:hypothetical protein
MARFLTMRAFAVAPSERPLEACISCVLPMELPFRLLRISSFPWPLSSYPFNASDGNLTSFSPSIEPRGKRPAHQAGQEGEERVADTLWN